MSNTIAFNGPRTLISRCLGDVRIGEHTVPYFTPSVPIGEVCVPLHGLLRALLPADQIAGTERAYRLTCRDERTPPDQTQVLITKEFGCIETVSASLACALVEAITSANSAEQLADVLVEATLTHLTDREGMAVARFESLTALHECACRPKGRAPGHWYHQRGKREAIYAEGKGVWRTGSGEWMASLTLALSYAQSLFPKFNVWTIQLAMCHPGAMAMLSSILGCTFVDTALSVPAPQKPRPALRLVHNADSASGIPPVERAP